jgi:hypothetical protein
MRLLRMVRGNWISAVSNFAGLGGTSLLNANVFIEADHRTLSQNVFPPEIRANPGDLDECTLPQVCAEFKTMHSRDKYFNHSNIPKTSRSLQNSNYSESKPNSWVPNSKNGSVVCIRRQHSRIELTIWASSKRKAPYPDKIVLASTMGARTRLS